MDPLFRKAALVAAVLGLILSIVLALTGCGGDEAGSTTATGAATTAPEPQVTPPQTTTEAETTAADGQKVAFRIVVGAGSAPEVKRLTVDRGTEVELVVESEVADEVHVHGYDLSEDAAPGAPATIDFTADAPGRFEIELEEHGLPIGELEVRP